MFEEENYSTSEASRVFAVFEVEGQEFYFLEDFMKYCRVYTIKEEIVVDGANLAKDSGELMKEIVKWIHDPFHKTRTFSKLRAFREN